jgi:hypothetical protein
VDNFSVEADGSSYIKAPRAAPLSLIRLYLKESWFDHLSESGYDSIRRRREIFGENMPGIEKVPVELSYEDMTRLRVVREPEQVKIEAIDVYPYPDLKRLWVRIALTPFDEKPSLDLEVFAPNGDLVSEMLIVEAMDYSFSVTMHLKSDPEPGKTYFLRASLVRGQEEVDLLEKTFDLVFVDL